MFFFCPSVCTLRALQRGNVKVLLWSVRSGGKSQGGYRIRQSQGPSSWTFFYSKFLILNMLIRTSKCLL